MQECSGGRADALWRQKEAHAQPGQGPMIRRTGLFLPYLHPSFVHRQAYSVAHTAFSLSSSCLSLLSSMITGICDYFPLEEVKF